MIRTRLTKAAGALAALAAGAIFAVASPAQPAVAYYSGGLFLDVVPLSPATLVASGAAVDVPVEITCNANYYPGLYVEVTERVGRGIATGNGFTPVACTGGHQRVLVRVAADAGRAFGRGDALVTGYLSGCLAPTFVCAEETGSREVTVRR